VRIAFLVAAAGALVLTAAPSASANGRFPASNGISFSPSDPSFIIMRTTFGLLFSHDGGNNWDWLCDQAVGITNPNSIEDPFLGITQKNWLVAALPIEGLAVSPAPNEGCSWSFVPAASAADAGDGGGDAGGDLLIGVKDVAVRPNDPHTIVALQSEYYTADAGGAAYATQVYQSTDDGAHWAALGVPIDPNFDATTVDVSATDPHRLYVSAFHQIVFPDGGSTRTASLFVSKDDGATWTERPTPFNPATETAVYIAAVDPGNPDKVYLRSGEGQSRLIVTSNAGATFTASQPLMGNMLGFALSPDGSKVWFGGDMDGLLELTDSTTLAWTQKSTIRVLCLGVHGVDLWACSDEPSGFIGGVSHDDGATFTAKLHLDSLRGPLACPPNSPDSGCNYAALCSNLGGCAGDGGPSDSGASGDGGSTPPSNQKASCGCSVVGGGGAGALLVLGFLGTVTAAARRRRRERPR
jgi:hypothetical protein